MLPEPIELNIGNICGGAVPEVFDREVQEILANIADINTDPEATRKITLEFAFKPSPDRKAATVVFACKSKVIGVEPKAGTIFFAKRLGKMEAYAEDPRQDMLFAKQETATPEPQ